MNPPEHVSGRCGKCFHPFDDHRLPTIAGGAVPICPPPQNEKGFGPR